MKPEKSSDHVVCKVCHRKLGREKLARHMSIHEGPFYTCKLCSYKTSRKDRYKNHQKLVHNLGRDLNNSCLFCNKQCQSPSHLELHLRFHTKERPYFCKICLAEFNRLDHFNSHLDTHDSNRKPQTTCPICFKGLYDKGHLEEHLRRHLGEKPYKCEICSKSFLRGSYLRTHKATHLIQKPYKCEICETRFSIGNDLTSHNQLHLKGLECQICKKPFMGKSMLLCHFRVHTNEKPFVCNVCNKGFAQQTSLKTHMRVHTGEKPYLCSQCSRTFSIRSNLKRHEKFVHSGEPK